MSGRYGPGERLPVERELSDRFAVSRSAVRQALLILDQQGLVRVRSGVGGGPFVTHETLPAAIAAFENMLAIDPTSVAEFAKAKLVLEPAATAMAAETISEEQIAALDASNTAVRASLERGEQARDKMIDFHSVLINSTGNRFLALVVELMGRALDRVPGVPDWSHIDPWQVLAEHERIVEALRRRDVEEVRELSATHLACIWRTEIDSA